VSDSGDLELAQQATRGNTAALSEIVQRHHAAVRTFLTHLSGQTARGDDLAQETFLTAIAQLRTYRGDAAMRTWLCGIAYRKHLADLRSTTRRRAREQHVAAESGAPATPQPEMRMDIREAFAALPLDQRAAAALCLASDMSHTVAAIALDIPLGTLKSRVAAAKQTLSKALEAYR
jgi:RNA polymerase sigma-70 factor (ECF subfamily)